MRTALLGLLLVACSSEQPKKNPLVAMAKKCPDSELACARPILHVESLRASQAYYRDKLGFKIDWDHGDPPNFGSVSRADFNVFLCEHCSSAKGAWSMTFTKSVDKLYDEFVAKKAIIKMPPTNMEWGLRELHVADPDGNVIRFGSAIDHD